MADELSQRQRLAQIESLFSSLIGNFEKIMLLYDESGAQAAIARLRLPEDALLAARLNELILQLDGEQARLLRDRFVADALQERQTWTLIMFCGALSVLVVFGGAFFVYRTSRNASAPRPSSCRRPPCCRSPSTTSNKGSRCLIAT